jgi:DNA polymerase delta subunit 2
MNTFALPKGQERTYQHQFADMYFLRLAEIKPIVEQIAEAAWGDFEIAGETARRVERVLDVRQGELCWVVGTVYMEMPLKPNVLDDISKEHWIAAPPPRDKFLSPETETLEQVMIEDESGRLRLAGALLGSQLLVTGCIIAVLGTENANGEFELLEVKVPDLPRQPERWERDDADSAMKGGKVKQARPSKAGKIAIVSGLDISGTEGDTFLLDMLSEYLLGEGPDAASASQISRLIIAGNSLSNSSPIPSREEMATKKAGKKYGYDASAYNPAPTQHLDAFLAALLPSIPITIMPGASDPANVALPQQPLHAALFLRARNYANPPSATTDATDGPSWFDSVTNPWQGDIDGHRFLGNGGQPVDDVFRYVDGDDRLGMMESALRWRLVAPTAPDTLWSYPFQDDDPLVVRDCPHVFFAGNQPRFDTAVIEGPLGQLVRLVAVPSFAKTGTLVLVDGETLEVECVEFEVFDSEAVR